MDREIDSFGCQKVMLTKIYTFLLCLLLLPYRRHRVCTHPLFTRSTFIDDDNNRLNNNEKREKNEGERQANENNL